LVPQHVRLAQLAHHLPGHSGRAGGGGTTAVRPGSREERGAQGRGR
jgi:hypothetical protein